MRESKESRLLEASQKFTGTEPNWKGHDFAQYSAEDIKMLIIRTLNWYAFESSTKESLTWLEKEFPGEKFSYAGTVGYLARMMARGFPRIHLEEKMRELASKIPRVNPEKQKEKIQKKIDAQPDPRNVVDPAVDKITETIDYAIDELLKKKGANPKFKISGLNRKQYEEVAKFIQKYLTEFTGASKREGYENINARLENIIVGFLTQLLQQIQINLPAEVQKKPRKKKEIPVDKIVKNFTNVDFGKYKTVGADKIHGAMVALLYDSKLRRVSVIYAQEGQFLSIKGKAIINFDEEKSFSKLLRKPELQLEELMRTHKLSIGRKLNEIKSVSGPAKFRASETTTILKTY